MKQCTDSILMVRPANFGFNIETAESNAFQINISIHNVIEIKAAAIEEFDNMVKLLAFNNIEVIVVEDSNNPVKTDAVFPNNWFSTHSDGSVITYPMYSPNRRLERRDEILMLLDDQFEVEKRVSYARYEEEDMILEGTGSMIIDRPNKLVYACISGRTDLELLQIFAEDRGYEVVAYTAVDAAGVPYYHTNVVMAIGDNIAVICLESIENVDERSDLERRLSDSGKEILEISRDQVSHFCGNMLQVNSTDGTKNMVMSSEAYENLTPCQRNQIEKYCRLIYSPLATIEKYGGGSARCMMAEIFLEKKL